MKKIIKFMFIVAVVGAAGYGLYKGYNWYKNKETQTTTTTVAPAFVQEMKLKNVFPKVSFVAKIEAIDTVGIRARVTGFLQQRSFKEGDFVQEGQLLYVIEQDNFKSDVEKADAEYNRALAQEQNAKAQYKRAQSLIKTKDISASRLDELEATEKSSAATVKLAKASLDLAKTELSYTEIFAPMTGKIRETKFSVGELIGPDSGILTEIVKMDPIEVVFSVSENQLAQLRNTFSSLDDVSVDFFNTEGQKYPHAGKIYFMDSALDDTTNTLRLKASFENPDNILLPGQYGRIELTSKKNVDAFVLPLQVIQRDMTGAFVFVVGKDNKIERRAIQTGTEFPNFDVIIESGLQAGDKVVVTGFQKMAVGMTVAPQIAE